MSSLCTAYTLGDLDLLVRLYIVAAKAKPSKATSTHCSIHRILHSRTFNASITCASQKETP
jgi:hypothetical protein